MEKELCKSIIRINKINTTPNKNETNPQNNLINQKELYGKEFIIWIIQNSNFCCLCKNKYDPENDFMI